MRDSSSGACLAWFGDCTVLEENSSALAQAAYENPGSNQRDPPLIGKNWGRSDDTIGIAGIVNGIAPNHQAYFAAGGFGILVGDGALPNYGLEQIVETYYSYAITDSTKVTFDYQFIANPRVQRRFAAR
jgi:hypothetical protein